MVARGEEPPSPGAASPVARSPSAVSDVSKAGSDMVVSASSGQTLGGWNSKYSVVWLKVATLLVIMTPLS